ncbi:MAG TPA: ABC transporter permease [Candidatus Polarisedimenticolia bacterium]|nr:ABC transporter permease [Candidatus Polarisedimenticolia bacterium]
MGTLLHVIVKELIQLRQDRRLLPAMIVGPVVQLLALGYAANSDVTGIPMVLVDQDRSSASRALVDRFLSSGSFVLAGTEPVPALVERWLVEGSAQVALVVAPGFGERTAAGRPGAVQLLVDGSDASSAVVGMGYASRILSAAAADMAPGAGRERPGVEVEPRVWYNPDLRSRWYYVPAILALTLMLTTMILPSMAVVREKEAGTMEQLIVTPLKPWQVIAGKLFPFVLVGLLDLLLVSGLVVFLFGVPLRGSFVLLAALTLLFLSTTLGLGLLVSAMVRTQQQAMVASTFLLMVPMLYLSGLIFPIENMPAPIQLATHAIPLRYYSNVIRGIFLKGSGLEVLWPEALFLAGFGAAALGMAALRFRKRLD